MTNLDNTIEKMQTLLDGLDRLADASKDLTEDQIESLMASPEFTQLLNTHKELGKAFDREFGKMSDDDH